jgi:hypothetical protein
MPAFGDVLSEAEIEAAVARVRSFAVPGVDVDVDSGVGSEPSGTLSAAGGR